MPKLDLCQNEYDEQVEAPNGLIVVASSKDKENGGILLRESGSNVNHHAGSKKLLVPSQYDLLY